MNERQWQRLQKFSLANPVLLAEKLDEPRDIECQDPAGYILGFTLEKPFLGNEVCAEALAGLYPGKTIHLKPVHHVFPVWDRVLETGLMVPLVVEPAETWHGASLFASFAENDSRPETGLERLMKEVEACWYGETGSRLPLRWRTGLSIRLHVPLHLGEIDGKSLQLPLILALLRGVCAAVYPIGETAWQDRPVFASACLLSDFREFDRVERLPDKARAFVREYGPGLPAVLLPEQREELAGCGILESFDPVHVITTLTDLLGIPELRQALERFARPPHPTEYDGMLHAMERHKRDIRFKDVQALGEWLLPELEKWPLYRFRVLRHVAMTLGHRGDVVGMKEKIRECRRIVEENPAVFSPQDQCDLATAATVALVDSLDPEAALELLGSIEDKTVLLPVAKQVPWWGSWCQALRFAGRFDQAVEAGREAVRLAEIGLASDAGRSRNYLIHALLDRVRAGAGLGAEQRQRDIDEIQTLLDESRTSWAPRSSGGGRHSHLTFCFHYAAELARVNNRPFSLPEQPPWKGDWGHAWYFALLSCARNRANTMQDRKMACDLLVRDKRLEKAKDPLFIMFRQIYRIYDAIVFRKESCREPLEALVDHLDSMAERGVRGWKKHLAPVLEQVRVSESGEAAERLCDMVPYH